MCAAGGAPAPQAGRRSIRWRSPNTSAAPRCPAPPSRFARTTAPVRASTWNTTVRTWPLAVAWRSRCACSGANTARWGAASTCSRSGASAPTGCRARPCRAVTTSPRNCLNGWSPRPSIFSPIDPQETPMSTTHRIAVIAGDGIGTEVMPEGIRVMEAAASKFNIPLQFDHFDFSSCDYHEKHGQMLPDDWKAQIGGHDAIYFGAVGWPDKVPDHVSLWGSLLMFRRQVDQYVKNPP